MRIKLLIKAPEFFFVPLKKVTLEDDPVTNRVYFVHAGRIVAVGERKGHGQANT